MFWELCKIPRWLTVTWITFHHLVGWLKHSITDISHRQLLVVGLLSRYYWSISSQRKVNSGIWHQVGLELSEIDIEGAIKPE